LEQTRGIPNQVSNPIVGRVTRNCFSQEPNQILITENIVSSESTKSFRAVLTNVTIEEIRLESPFIHSINSLNHLNDGDIIVINSDGIINTLYRHKSHHNFLFVTSNCNSNCLMCSQPPKERDDIPYWFDINRQLISILPKDCTEIGITGGEPTLLGELFFELLQIIRTRLPETAVHCLTNGRYFARSYIAQRLGDMQYSDLMLGIPLYSDYYQLHDYIVQSKNAFYQTVQGLYNLAIYNQRIEIRIVLHKLTIPRLTKLARFIYKNLPFVEHIAFMGLEYEGYTPHNINKLWINPVEYMNELCEAVVYLSTNGMNVSIYNLQLCLMPKELWKFNKKSISDWKKIYSSECMDCSLVNDCGGLFASNIKVQGVHLKPFM
jgi:His-Xaa-Ser system radical SAM maturase HxsC